MKMTKTIMRLLILTILVVGCVPSECSPCTVTNNTCTVIEFVDTAMPSHKGCVRAELYNPEVPVPVCVSNFNYTLAGYNLDCERTNESSVGGIE